MNEAQRILQLTGGGLDVFVHYLGENVLRRHFVTPFGKTANHLVIYMSTIEVVEISNTIFKILVTAAFVETVLRL